MPESNSPVSAESFAKLSAGTAKLVDRSPDLDKAADLLKRGSATVAIDTERAQGYRYGNEAYLVQIRRDDVGTFLVDSNALEDLERLSTALPSPWIFHAASQDLPALEQVNLVPTSIFDTEVAARLLGERHFSLQAVTETFLGITLEKTHQNEDWSVRPLPATWLLYAAMDVELLGQLKSELENKLEKLERTPWAEEEFHHLLTHPANPKPRLWTNMKGIKTLRGGRQLAIAKILWETREETAQAVNIGPERILSSKTIIETAKQNPRTRKALHRIRGYHSPLARKHFEQWWNGLLWANSLTEREFPALEHTTSGTVPPARMWKRLSMPAFGRLEAIRAYTAAAAEPLDIEPEVLLEPRVQREVTWHSLDKGQDLLEQLSVHGARSWQIQQLQAHGNINELIKKL